MHHERFADKLLGGSWEEGPVCSAGKRMMALCLRTVQAAQRTSFDDVAPRRLPHVHVWARWTPFAWGSVLDAGRVRDTVSDSTVMAFSLSADNSISRRSHQHPVIIAFRGPTGPFGCHGFAAPGREYARWSGNGADRCGGPMPRRAARKASCLARSSVSHQTPPPFLLKEVTAWLTIAGVDGYPA